MAEPMTDERLAHLRAMTQLGRGTGLPIAPHVAIELLAEVDRLRARRPVDMRNAPPEQMAAYDQGYADGESSRIADLIFPLAEAENDDELQRETAKLVARAVAEEREASAVIAEELQGWPPGDMTPSIADAIRSRSSSRSP